MVPSWGWPLLGRPRLDAYVLHGAVPAAVVAKPLVPVVALLGPALVV